jgi:hypothetical protein
VGRNTDAITRRTIVAITARSTHRQPCDGGWPVGNTISTAGIKAAVTNVQLLTQAAQIGAGSEPGFVTSAYVTYSAIAPPSSRPSPMTRNSQPIGLCGTRLARSTPSAT